MGVIHQGPAASRDRKERNDPGTKPSSKDAPHQDAPTQAGRGRNPPGGSCCPMGQHPSRLGGRYRKASPSCSHPRAPQQLCFGTAGTGWTREGFESGWLKFNPSPAARALSATTVTWEHKLPLFPHASLSCQLPALSTFLAASPHCSCSLAGDS